VAEARVGYRNIAGTRCRTSCRAVRRASRRASCCREVRIEQFIDEMG